LVYEIDGLTVGIEDLTRVVNRSMVLAFIPAPLFLVDGFADVACEGEWLR
jgi:hypothetical protein